jgi:hypothetical protein
MLRQRERLVDTLMKADDGMAAVALVFPAMVLEEGFVGLWSS